MKQLTISLVTYNSERFLADFCDSLQAQTFTDWDLLVMDNNSFDRSAATIVEHIPAAKVVRQKNNLGFAKAHNLNIQWSKSPYILVVNPDIVMEPDCLALLVAAMEQHEQAGSVGAALLYWDAETKRRTNIVDSYGIALGKNYNAIDAAQGLTEKKFDERVVFGVSGALVLYRREALEAVAFVHGKEREYFDEDFFAYKEDVDLAWRLQIAGYQSFVIGNALAYHHRTIAGTRASRHERQQRGAVNRYSYRNHVLMVYKNQYWAVSLRKLFPILWFEVRKFVYLLFLDRSSVKGLIQAIRLLPRFRTKRHVVVQSRKLKAKEFEQWLM